MVFSTNKKNILMVLADGKLHSSTELTKKTNLSSSTIDTQIRYFAQLGLEFSTIGKQGYSLTHALQLLSKSQINKTLSQTASNLIATLEIHHSIDSSNSYLLKQAKNNATLANNRGKVCLTEYQTAGRGRNGRKWVSPFASNISLSVLWTFKTGYSTIYGLSLVVGVIVIQALNDCGIFEVNLKWPNDIYWRQKKLAGILIEASGGTKNSCNVVIGLGLNFYLPKKQAKSITQDWTDLTHIAPDNSSKIRNKLVAILLNYLLPTLANFNADTLTYYLNKWRQYDYLKGQQATLYTKQQAFTGVVTGINNQGELLLQNKQGEIKAFASGEVSSQNL